MSPMIEVEGGKWIKASSLKMRGPQSGGPWFWRKIRRFSGWKQHLGPPASSVMTSHRFPAESSPSDLRWLRFSWFCKVHVFSYRKHVLASREIKTNSPPLIYISKGFASIFWSLSFALLLGFGQNWPVIWPPWRVLSVLETSGHLCGFHSDFFSWALVTRELWRQDPELWRRSFWPLLKLNFSYRRTAEFSGPWIKIWKSFWRRASVTTSWGQPHRP